MEQRIVFNGCRDVDFIEFTPDTVKPDQVRIKIEVSMISTGTEMIVFNRLFSPGTNWDNWVKYPFYPGYAVVGIVEEVGAEVTSLKVGDRVVNRGSHASMLVVNAADCYPVPDSIPSEQAVWFALAKIASMAARVAKAKLGDQIVIIGAGPVGQMMLRWMAAAGAEKVIVVDTVQKRLELAKAGGATHVICATADKALDEIKLLTNGKLADIVIDTTGIAPVFSDALKCVKNFGKMVLLGDTGYPEQQHLAPDLLSRGLTIVGAHDCHETEEWNSKKMVNLMFSLAERGRFNLEGLNTNEFNPADCEQAYDLLNNDRSNTMGVIFKW